MAAITDIELAAAMNLGDGVSTLSEPISSIVTRLNAVGQAYVQLYIPMAPDAIKNEAIVRFASYLYDAPSASADGRFAAAWFNSGASALAAPFMALSVSGTAELAAGPGQPAMGVDQAAVNALISAAVYAWAQAEDLTTIPVAKIPNLPSSKITDLPSGLQPSVALANRVTSLERFKEDLTFESDYTTSTAIIVAGSKIPYRVQSTPQTPYYWPPDDTAGEVFRVTIQNRPQSALVHIGDFETTVHAVYEKPAIDTNTVTQMDSTNSIAFTLGGITFYLGRDTSNVIIFSADDIDTYTLRIIDRQPDFHAWTHLSSATLIPLTNIPPIPASKITGLPTGGGLTTTQVRALIADWAETGNAALIPSNKLPAGTGGSGSLSAADRARLDDLTYTTSTTTPGSTIVSRTNVDVLFAADAYRVGTAKWPDESTATATITVSRRQGSVYTVQGTFDITLTAIYAKDALSTADLGYGTLALTASNATEFRLNNINFYIARLDDDGIVFSSNEAFDFAVAITLASVTTSTSVTDLQDWARVSSSDLIPSTKISGLPAAGLDRTAVLALIADWAETGNATTVPVAKIPSLPASKITGLPTGGSGSLSTEDRALLDSFDYTYTLVTRQSVNFNALDPQGISTTLPPTSSATLTIKIWRFNSLLGSHDVVLSQLYTKPIQTAPYNRSAFRQSANSISFTLSNLTFYIGRGQANTFLFSTFLRSTYEIEITSSQTDLQSWARVSSSDLIPRAKLAAAHLNTVTARGQATVTASNDAAGSAVAFGSVNQVTEGDIVMISLDPATTSDGNATVITRIPPSEEDVWFSANEFQSESGVTDNVQAKLTNGTSYVSMQLERGSHTTAPKFIRGNYTLYRINA